MSEYEIIFAAEAYRSLLGIEQADRAALADQICDELYRDYTAGFDSRRRLIGDYFVDYRNLSDVERKQQHNLKRGHLVAGISSVTAGFPNGQGWRWRRSRR